MKVEQTDVPRRNDPTRVDFGLKLELDFEAAEMNDAWKVSTNCSNLFLEPDP